MKWFLFALLALSKIGLCSESSAILSCSAKGEEISAEVIVDAVGGAEVKIKNLKTNKKMDCQLQLKYLGDQRKNVIPAISLEFIRGPCQPAVDESTTEILTDPNLVIQLTTHPDRPKTQLHWLRTEQPADCVLKVYRAEEILRNAKLWKEGAWGK